MGDAGRAPRGAFPRSLRENRGRSAGPGLRPAAGCQVRGAGQPPIGGGVCEGRAAHWRGLTAGYLRAVAKTGISGCSEHAPCAAAPRRFSKQICGGTVTFA